jgi:hypothetical protein
VRVRVKFYKIKVFRYYFITVSDGKDQGQPACQEEWNMCRKKRRIVMPM